MCVAHSPYKSRAPDQFACIVLPGRQAVLALAVLAPAVICGPAVSCDPAVCCGPAVSCDPAVC